MEKISMKQDTRFDVKEVFRKKNPKVAKLLPGFIYNYIIKIVHQDDLNDFLSRHGHKKGLDFVNGVITDFNISFQINGEENIPREPRLIFASNHPLGGFDGIMLMHHLGKHYNDLRFLVNDILMNIPGLNNLFIPINKHGSQGRENARLIEEIYESDMPVLTFPFGLVSRRKNDVIKDLVWHKSFIQKAKKHKRNIIPVHISGRNSNFFYNLSSLRKKLGIKTNIEMFYLVNETYKHRDKTFQISFGKPIPYTLFDKTYTDQEWAEKIKEHVYDIAKDMTREFRP
ncbi:MAG: 1-acyl-sn-glycerol-3-phosphate acyltransferase [Bacteroidota bacterium]